MSFLAKFSAFWHEVLPDWIIRNLPWATGLVGYAVTNWDWVKTIIVVWTSMQIVRFSIRWYRIEMRRRRFVRENPGVTVPAELE